MVSCRWCLGDRQLNAFMFSFLVDVVWFDVLEIPTFIYLFGCSRS